MDKFVTRISGAPCLNPNPILQKPSETLSTSSSVSTSVTTCAPDDLNLLGPSRPKLNLFPKDNEAMLRLHSVHWKFFTALRKIFLIRIALLHELQLWVA